MDSTLDSKVTLLVRGGSSASIKRNSKAYFGGEQGEMVAYTDTLGIPARLRPFPRKLGNAN